MMRIMIVLLFASLFLSCGKDKLKLNEITTSISGKVHILPHGIGAPNVDIRIYFYKPSWVVPSYKEVALIKTDNQGNYNTDIIIDTTLFTQGYYLEIKALPPDNYVGSYLGDQFLESVKKYENRPFVFAFFVYQKTKFSLELRNTLNENFQQLSIGYLFGKNTIQGPTYYNYQTMQIKDTVLPGRVTAADVVTKVYWRKVYSPGIIKNFEDSIVCTPNGPNNFILNY